MFQCVENLKGYYWDIDYIFRITMIFIRLGLYILTLQFVSGQSQSSYYVPTEDESGVEK